MNPEWQTAITKAANALRKCRHRLTSKIRYKTNPTARKQSALCSRRYYQRHIERARKWRSLYFKKNKERQNEYHRFLRKNNAQFLISERLRARLGKALKRRGQKKQSNTASLIGCSNSFLKVWIESQFECWMNWSNASEWHIEHIVPLSAFDLTDPEEIKWCCFYRNLKPLSKEDNQSKKDALPSPLPSWLPAPIAERILTRRSKKMLTSTCHQPYKGYQI